MATYNWGCSSESKKNQSNLKLQNKNLEPIIANQWQIPSWNFIAHSQPITKAI